MSTPMANTPMARAASFHVRHCREGDIARVVEIEIASFTMPWKEDTFRGLLKRTDSDFLVAEMDGDVVGYATAWTVLDQAELGNVAVAPEARGAGVGGALVDAVVDHVRDRGAAELFLEVRVSNEAAKSVYRQRGFTGVGRRRSYYSHPTEDALVMRLRIQSFA
ncbi:MAG TPA: ribosomal protein S18-alanine N-acetyltransferase [Longimicrobium sp.]|jgi:ribosomal-protein-alanine N-acetyltransferase|uniref:ribosomal protein S18-alanine N-acetyltransferase n=1 Tax=Longimicrobium sp. TaxID=2029185 RepID=UPI002EDA7022